MEFELILDQCVHMNTRNPSHFVIKRMRHTHRQLWNLNISFQPAEKADSYARLHLAEIFYLVLVSSTHIT